MVIHYHDILMIILVRKWMMNCELRLPSHHECSHWERLLLMVVNLKGIHSIREVADEELVISNGFSTYDAKNDTL